MGLTSSIQNAYGGLVFRPPAASYTITAVTMIDDAIAARWMPCPNAVATILYSHGNATDLGHITQGIRRLGLTHRCNVLLWDYPGYGTSTGTHTERSISLAIKKVFAYYQKHWASAVPVILMGYSLGTGPTCYLASELSKAGVEYGGVILEAPLASVISTVLPDIMASSSYSVDMFTNCWTVTEITRPVYILHGVRDSVIPWTAGQTLAHKVPNLWAFRLIPGADHHNLQSVDAEYDAYLNHFLTDMAP